MKAVPLVLLGLSLVLLVEVGCAEWVPVAREDIGSSEGYGLVRVTTSDNVVEIESPQVIGDSLVGIAHGKVHVSSGVELGAGPGVVVSPSLADARFIRVDLTRYPRIERWMATSSSATSSRTAAVALVVIVGVALVVGAVIWFATSSRSGAGNPGG